MRDDEPGRDATSDGEAVDFDALARLLPQRYPHRLIDILDPAEAYSAADFRRDALQAMAEITGRGKIPLLVGGTML